MNSRGDLRQLVVRPDREQVERRAVLGALRDGLVGEPLRAPGEAGQGEAVAVALGDRDDAGVGPHGGEQVRAPALAVDAQRQAHPRLAR